MVNRFRRDPLVGNVLALVAVFVALGGAGYAAFKLPNDSVRSKHIKDGQVKSQDVKNDHLTGKDVNESQLAEVPRSTDSDLLDGLSSSAFLGASSKAVDADKLDGADSSAFAPRTRATYGGLSLNSGSENGVDTWRCHWTAYGGVYSSPGRHVDATDRTHLKGLVKANDGFMEACGENAEDFVIADVPILFNHGRRVYLTIAGEAPARVDVHNGKVSIQAGFPTWAAAKDYVSLEGIVF